MDSRSTRAAVTDICLQLKKVLGLLKFYRPDHALVAAAFSHIQGVISTQLQTLGDLCLRISSLAIRFGDEAVYQAERPEESITQPLFLDGVQEIWFRQGLDQRELQRFMMLWNTAFERKVDTVRSFTTDCWEADFSTIGVVALATFSETAHDDDEEERKRRNEISTVIAQISSDVLAGQDRKSARRSIRISHLDLAVLTTPGVSEITAEDLKKRDRSRGAAVRQIDEAAERTLVEELSRPIESVFVRAFRDLAEVNDAGDPADSARLGDLVRRLLVYVTEGRRTDQLLGIVETQPKYAHTAAGASVPSAIATPELLDMLVAMLEEEAHENVASAALNLAPRSSTADLLDRLAGCAGARARRRLTECIVTLSPSGEAIATRLQSAGEETAEALLLIARSLGAEDFAMVRRSGVSSPIAAVRKTLVSTMSKQEILDDRLVLYPLLADQDADVRRALLHAFVSARDAGVVPSLDWLLSSASIDEAERRGVLSALGVIGGGAASAILRREIQAGKDTEQTAAAIRALARAEGEGARELIESLKKGWFVKGPVKAACEEALKRIVSRGPSTGEFPLPPQPPAVPRSATNPPLPARSASSPSGSTPPARSASTPSGPLRLPSSPPRTASSPGIAAKPRAASSPRPVSTQAGDAVLTGLRMDEARLEMHVDIPAGTRLTITIPSSQGPYLSFDAVVSAGLDQGALLVAIEPLPERSRPLLERIVRPNARIPVTWKRPVGAPAPNAIDDLLKAYVDEEDTRR